MDPMQLYPKKNPFREALNRLLAKALKIMGPRTPSPKRSVALMQVRLDPPFDEWVHTALVSPGMAARMGGLAVGDRVVVRRTPIKVGHRYVDYSRYKGDAIRRLGGTTHRRFPTLTQTLDAAATMEKPT